ncbi:MAG TPA: hypothetical protein VFS39_13585 [Nitrospira sp.]|nr:hypothetical protein [Nitrospira sp.]
MRAILCASFGFVIVSLAGGCVGQPPLPEQSRTGRVVEVTIGESVTPTEVTAKPGDEIRWTNTGTDPVVISFMGALDEHVSCQKGFASAGLGSLFQGVSSQFESLVVATVHGGQHVSLCFADAGTYPYSLKKEKKDARNAPGLSGRVIIE